MVKKIRSYQMFTSNITGAKFQRKRMNGRNFLVVPGVIIKEGVWTGNNGPILYQDRENAKSESGWDHKPATLFHPKTSGKPVSACNPVILHKQQVGIMLHTRNRNKALGTQFWLEERLLKKKARDVYEDVLAGRKVEVSTGMKMTLELVPGVHNGKKYIGRATNIEPDHVALLPGSKGACSLKDGAGLYQINQLVYNGLKEEGELDDSKLELVNRISKNLQRLISNKKGTKMADKKKLVLVKKVIRASNGSLTEEDDLKYLLKKDDKYLNKQLKWYENELANKRKKKRLVDDDEEEEEDLVDNEDEEEDDDDLDLEEEEDDEEEEEEVPAKKVKFAKKKKKAKAVAKNESEDDEEEEEVPVRKKKAVNKEQSEEEWLKSIPKTIRKKFLRMQQNEEEEKEKLIAVIMKNPRNDFSERYLGKKEIEELRAMARLAVANKSNDEDEDDDEEMFLAAAGARDDSDIENEEDPDFVALPTVEDYQAALRERMDEERAIVRAKSKSREKESQMAG